MQTKILSNNSSQPIYSPLHLKETISLKYNYLLKEMKIHSY